MPGLHLPASTAALNGLFGEYGLDVEFVYSPPGRDLSLSGLAERVRAVGRGAAEFGLTSVPYVMAAQAEAKGAIPVRFVASLHQRNPIAGLVRSDSDIRVPADLPGRRAAGHTLAWFVAEYEAVLAHLGLGRAQVVERPERYYAAASLASGEVEVIPTWADTVTVVRNAAGLEVRSIPLDIAVYSTGVLAADSVPHELASRLTAALAAGFELQQADPEPGFEAFTARFPDMPVDDVRRNWSVFASLASGAAPFGYMGPKQWEATVDFTAKAHDLAVIDVERLYRPEMVSRPGRLVEASR